MTRKLQILIGVVCLASSALAQDIPSLKICGADGQRPQRQNNAGTTLQIPKDIIASKATSVESRNVKLITMDGVVGYIVTPMESIQGQTLTPLNQDNSNASKVILVKSSTVKIVTMDGVVGYSVTPTESIVAVK